MPVEFADLTALARERKRKPGNAALESERVPKKTWILTGSPDNYAATVEHEFSVVGIKERNRTRALTIEPGDDIVFYLTKVMAFAAIATITGEMYEDREKIWPGKPGNPDAYPWRFPAQPSIVVAQEKWLPAEALVDKLEHIGKWPREHWKLAFQGQLRTVGSKDATLLRKRLAARAK
jgi:hypothetical protein